jgi:adhesin transport system membrane fusion protein
VETQLYKERRNSLESNLRNLRNTLSITQQERGLLAPLVQTGAASKVELLRLDRQIAELNREISESQNDYLVRAREALSRANAEVETQKPIVAAKLDALDRIELRSPVRGIIKKINVMTIGGVLPNDGKLMEIVPIDEKLLVEAHIMPNDIAFIRPGLPATVKVTAYDYAIYGGLKGKVTVISPDTIQDDIKRDQFYYRVNILTEEDYLVNKAGQKFTIAPGMITTTDIHTGKKTVLDYLIKPFNRANEALRQR